MYNIADAPKQTKAMKVIATAASPLLQKLLKPESEHSHPVSPLLIITAAPAPAAPAAINAYASTCSKQKSLHQQSAVIRHDSQFARHHLRGFNRPLDDMWHFWPKNIMFAKSNFPSNSSHCQNLKRVWKELKLRERKTLTAKLP